MNKILTGLIAVAAFGIAAGASAMQSVDVSAPVSSDPIEIVRIGQSDPLIDEAADRPMPQRGEPADPPLQPGA